MKLIHNVNPKLCFMSIIVTELTKYFQHNKTHDEWIFTDAKCFISIWMILRVNNNNCNLLYQIVSTTACYWLSCNCLTNQLSGSRRNIYNSASGHIPLVNTLMSLSSKIGLFLPIPALFTKISILIFSDSISCIMFLIASLSVISMFLRINWSDSLESSLSFWWDLPSAMTFAPDLAYAVAIARPNPLDAPVTRAVFPVRLNNYWNIMCLLLN